MQKMCFFGYSGLQDAVAFTCCIKLLILCLPRLEAELSGKLLLTGHFFFFFLSTLGRPGGTIFPWKKCHSLQHLRECGCLNFSWRFAYMYFLYTINPLAVYNIHLLELGFVHVANEQRKPTDSVDVVLDGNSLVDGVNVT
jgi:hypothetical protein